MSALMHPPGGLPDGAPKGLVDIILLPQPPSPVAQFTHTLTQDSSTLGIVLGGIICLLIGIWWLRRDWRGRLLRWQVQRLQRLIQREPQATPEPVGTALAWALARYFRHRPGLNRQHIPPEWQPLVQQFDALRFAATPRTSVAWLDLLAAIRQRTRTGESQP